MIKIVYLITSCKKSGPIQQTLNIIRNLDREIFIPYLITIYDETEDSVLEQFLPYVEHLYVKTGKKDILINRTKQLKDCLDDIAPDIIHTLGVFPDFVVCRMKRFRQINTLRNYIYDDLPSKFGKLKGGILCAMSHYVMKRTSKTVTCSHSLSEIYERKMELKFDYIRNGIDVEKYSPANQQDKLAKRRALGIPEECILIVYSGQFIPRKNQEFLLRSFEKLDAKGRIYLMLLGDGPDYMRLKTEFEQYNILFMGNVDNVADYLRVSDLYISTSRSEGMPNGVMEAMASGLPYILSDIPQHKEIYDVNKQCGYLYRENDEESLKEAIDQMLVTGLEDKAKESVIAALNYFSDRRMSEEYQRVYRELVMEGN